MSKDNITLNMLGIMLNINRLKYQLLNQYSQTELDISKHKIYIMSRKGTENFKLKVT